MPILVAVGKTRPFLYYLQSNGNVIALQANHSVDQLHEWFSELPKCNDSNEVIEMLVKSVNF